MIIAMSTNKRIFTLRLEDENFDKIKFIADKNKRSITMQIEYLVEKCIEEYEEKHGSIRIPEND